MIAKPKPAGPAPSRSQLHEAALRHLARFATTEAGLVRVLERRVQRWARLTAGEGLEVGEDLARASIDARAVAAALVASGVISDAVFAAARARRLVRAGRSARAIAGHLAAKGVSADMATASLPTGEQELHAALTLARRRRLGPFRAEADTRSRLQEMAVLARAGFGREAAERALGMDGDEAEALVLALKRS